MSDRPARPVSEEALFLRANWARLRDYEHRWIAVNGSNITDFDTDLAQLLRRTARFEPLYAFVYLGDM